jgi:hypothetical protein
MEKRAQRAPSGGQHRQRSNNKRKHASSHGHQRQPLRKAEEGSALAGGDGDAADGAENTDTKRSRSEVARLEKPPAKKKRKGRDESVDSDSDDGDNGDISLEGSLYDTRDDVTFEFQDTSAAHAEGLTVLFRTFIKNPTTAYEMAASVGEDGSANELSDVVDKSFVCPVSVGTTIVCENATDTFAFLTVVNPVNEKVRVSECHLRFSFVISIWPALLSKGVQDSIWDIV